MLSLPLRALGIVLILAASGVVASCASDGVSTTATTSSSSGGSSAGDTTTSTADDEDFVAEADDFVNVADMTPVRGFFVDNRLGHLEEAVAVAESPDGGVYPVGTIIQLVPQEAMVKRGTGYSPEFADWEFFILQPTAEGTEIVSRGGPEVVNRFGGSSATCHAKADLEFDFVCEADHGCDPLPIGDDMFQMLVSADPRPRADPTTATTP